MSKTIEKQCSVCDEKFMVEPWRKTSAKYCSRSCSGKTHAMCKNDWEYRFKEGRKNENNPSWKGEAAGYMAKHNWVRRHYGDLQICQHCFTQDKRKYHWANKSGLYLRNREDWLRLCVPCHKKYDLQKISNNN